MFLWNELQNNFTSCQRFRNEKSHKIGMGIMAASRDIHMAVPMLLAKFDVATKVWIEFFLNYQQHKVGISGNYFFPYISFVKFIIATYKFNGKVKLNF